MMATVLIALLWSARDLKVVELVREGFRRPGKNLINAVIGLGIALVAIMTLFAVAFAMGDANATPLSATLARIPKYFLSAITIAIVEEAFFRAVLLGGMKRDLGRRTTLIASSAIYAIAHLVRSPAKFYVTGFEPFAGLVTLTHSLDQLMNPAVSIPTLIGLFVLGLVLGEAYLLTGTVYLSIGLHAGLVLGAKLFPKLVERASIPWWLAGSGGPAPLVAGPAAWIIALTLLALMPRIARLSDPKWHRL
jgi:membrane protease YdiL (CAAX protease family)